MAKSTTRARGRYVPAGRGASRGRTSRTRKSAADSPAGSPGHRPEFAEARGGSGALGGARGRGEGLRAAGGQQIRPAVRPLATGPGPGPGFLLGAPSRRCAPACAMRPGGVRSFVLELARVPGGAYRGGERLCGRVLLEAAAPLRVRALEVAARGGAATHWLEGRSVGVNAVSSDYAAAETYLRRRQLLLRGEPLAPHSPAGIPRGPLSPGLGALLQCPESFDLEVAWSGDPS